MSALNTFREEFLHADTWAQRKDGVPLYLLDKLSESELKTAEKELIEATGPGDSWPIIGLGHIKSTNALPVLYKLLTESSKSYKVTIAHSIFQICGDQKMIEIALEETPGINQWTALIDILYMLPDFKDERVDQMLNDFCYHSDHLIQYNARRASGLPYS